HRDDFPGVEAVRLAQRQYAHGSLAAHVLGYVGEINDRELAEREGEGYRLGDEIGKFGVEQAYESDLRGRPGVTRLEVNATGQVVGVLESRLAVQGKDLQLTLDLDVQRVAEESLAQGLAAATRRANRPVAVPPGVPPPPVKPVAGSAVVLDPRDGSVLAMASNPGFDPALFVNGIRPDVFGALQDPVNNYPLNNRAIQGQYAPGSTFKLFTAIAALREGMVTPSTPFNDEGFFRLRNCRGTTCLFRNAGSQRYGRVNLARAITVSSDAYFYNLGAEFWFQRDRFGDGMQEAARDLGLGRRTGVDLAGEKQGRVPDPETRKRLNAENPKAFPNARWFAGDNVNLAIGQGEMALTPLQLANAYATFANGGSIYKPRVAARVLQQSGQVVREVAPATVGRVDLPAPIRTPILQGLEGAVADPKGTAVSAFAGFPLPVLPVAGKTGTAEVRGARNDTALFVAFAPAAAPQYVVAVIMEESGFGGSAAAPVARRIFEALAGTPPGPVELVPAIE
ncbi:MAG TPA: penicillin-binding protein 2, partial [Acidimicrobiales bacterium]|nr:penicillin-binding protein 2 [Acidimicrobiales bacterium]